MRTDSRRALWLYFGFLTAFAVTFSAIAALTGLRGRSVAFWLLVLLYMWTPAASAFFATKLTRLQLRIRFDVKWWICCAAIGTLIPLASVLVTLFGQRLDAAFQLGWGMPRPDFSLIPGASFPMWMRFFALALLGLFAGATSNAVAAFGEEFGWRSFMYETTRDFGFWRSSFVTGLVWGVWHIPVVARGLEFDGSPVTGCVALVVLCVLLAPIFAMLRDAGAPVTAVAALHGAINATAGVSLLLFGADSLKHGTVGVPGFIVLAVIDVGILLRRRMNITSGRSARLEGERI